MKREDFLNLDNCKGISLIENLVLPTSSSGQSAFPSATTSERVFLLVMDYDGPLCSIRLMPGTCTFIPSKFNLSNVALAQKYPTPRQLKKDKLDNLYGLMSYVPPQHTWYLKQLFRCTVKLNNK